MKNINFAKSFTLFLFVLLFSASFTLAQDATKKDCEKSKEECCSSSKVKTAEHKCTDKCKTAGCDVVKAKEAKLSSAHVCADEGKTVGCDAVKATGKKMSIKHACTDECKTAGCDAVKAAESKLSSSHECTDKCHTAGCTAKS